MALALSGLSGLSGIMTAGSSATPDPGTTETYWRDGQPNPGLRNDLTVSGTTVYWRDGQPSVYLAIP